MALHHNEVSLFHHSVQKRKPKKTLKAFVVLMDTTNAAYLLLFAIAH